jgi:hypothetical protein
MTNKDQYERLLIILKSLKSVELLEDTEDSEADFSEQRAGRRVAQHLSWDEHSFMTEPLELGREAHPEPVSAAPDF